MIVSDTWPSFSRFLSSSVSVLHVRVPSHRFDPDRGQWFFRVKQNPNVRPSVVGWEVKPVLYRVKYIRCCPHVQELFLHYDRNCVETRLFLGAVPTEISQAVGQALVKGFFISRPSFDFPDFGRSGGRPLLF